MTTSSSKPIVVNGVLFHESTKVPQKKVQVDLDNLGEVYVTEPTTEESSTHGRHD